MPDVTGTLKPPRLASAPASPTVGQMYFDTGLNQLLYWNGTAWLSSQNVYKGDWVAGSYNDGDIVVGPDGIEYMAVRSTSQTPGGWPATPPGIPAGGTTGQALVKTSATDYATQWATPPSIPTPVVNGQWIKGVGGAAVWSAIAQSDLPSPLAAIAAAPPSNDLNNATASGWYQILTSMSNLPSAINGFLQVFADGSSTKQVAYQRGADSQWTRYNNAGGGWSAWTRVSKVTVAGTVAGSNGAVLAGSGFTATRTSAGNYTITLATAISNFFPIAGVIGQSAVIGAGAASSTTFNVWITTPAAWMDANFNFIVIDLT